MNHLVQHYSALWKCFHYHFLYLSESLHFRYLSYQANGFSILSAQSLTPRVLYSPRTPTELLFWLTLTSVGQFALRWINSCLFSQHICFQSHIIILLNPSSPRKVVKTMCRSHSGLLMTWLPNNFHKGHWDILASSISWALNECFLHLP